MALSYLGTKTWGGVCASPGVKGAFGSEVFLFSTIETNWAKFWFELEKLRGLSCWLL